MKWVRTGEGHHAPRAVICASDNEIAEMNLKFVKVRRMIINAAERSYTCFDDRHLVMKEINAEINALAKQIPDIIHKILNSSNQDFKNAFLLLREEIFSQPVSSQSGRYVSSQPRNR